MTWTVLRKPEGFAAEFISILSRNQTRRNIGVQTNNPRRAEKRSRPISEINVTPFVDVMLVLLVVFMVTAPLLVLGIPVQLPKVSKEYIIADDDTPLNVEVDEEKRIYINKKEIPLFHYHIIQMSRQTQNQSASQRGARLNYGAIAVVAGE